VWIGFPTTQDCRRQKSWSLNTLIAIVQFTRPRQTRQTELFCRLRCGGVNRVGPTARQVRSVSGLCRSVSGGAIRPPETLRRRTRLSGGQFTPPHQTRQDYRQSTAGAATQARQAATPSRPTAHTQRRKCKHAVDCCIWLNLKKIFTKCHATVQTLSDCLETHFTPPDTTQSALSCRVWWVGGVNWA